MERCPWNGGEALIRYHDTEWGAPLHDDRALFEFLMLEALQCGLNWNVMLQKREIFRACFRQFDYEAVARFGEEEIDRILAVPGMLRSRRKVEAVVRNARHFLEVRAEYGSFDAYLWGFTQGRIYCYQGHESGRVPTQNALSRQVSGDLRRRGFSFLGGVTVYSFLQACGVVNDHCACCFRREAVLRGHPWVALPPEEEA